MYMRNSWFCTYMVAYHSIQRLLVANLPHVVILLQSTALAFNINMLAFVCILFVFLFFSLWKTNELILTAFAFLQLYGRGLYKVDAWPALLAGITYSQQWVWHLWLTICAQLCWLGIVFMSVDVMLLHAALYQRGQPWPADCTSSQPTN